MHRWALLFLIMTGCASAPKPKGKSPGQLATARMMKRPAAGMLPRIAVPLSYDVAIKADPRKPRFSGVVKIHLKLKAAARKVHFHGDDMKISSVVAHIGKLRRKASVKTYKPRKGISERVATFPVPLPKGKVVLRIVYDSPFDKKLSGLYRAKHGDNWYAYTQFEAADARKAFPCLDEPRFKVPFSLTLTVPKSMRAFANTPQAERKEQGDWAVVKFLKTKPLPTYLVAMVIGDLDYVKGPVLSREAGDLPIGGIVVKGKAELVKPALQIAFEQVKLLEEYFGIPYPYRKLDVVGVVNFGSGAMENAGLITFREERLLFNEKTASTSMRRAVGGIMAHELAHQWFGNLVTMRWWDDLWLNEAFATWMGTKIMDIWRPEYRSGERLLGWRNDVFVEDALAASKPVRQPVLTVAQAEQAFNALTYGKGSTVLGMIEQWTGKDAFRDGVRHYLNKHKWKNATAADLFKAIGDKTGKPVAKVARSFLDRPGVPVVAAKLICAEGKKPTVKLNQIRYRSLGARTGAKFPGGKPWTVPICVGYPQGKSVATACTLLSGKSGALELPGSCPAWIYPNANEAGYYRWSVDGPMLSKLVAKAGKLKSIERMALLEQSWAAVKAGKLDPGVYVAALNALKKSREHAVVMQLIHGLQRIAHIWVGHDSSKMKRAASKVLGPVARWLGKRARRREDAQLTMLRPAVLGSVARLAKDRRVIRWAQKTAARYLRSPSKVDRELAPVAVRIAARNGALKFEKLKAFASTAKQSTDRVNALQGLGSLRGAELDRALALLTEEQPVRSQDIWYLLRPAMADPVSREQTMAFLQKNYDKVAKRMPSMGWRSAARLASLVSYYCEKESLGAVQRFFAKKVDENSRRYFDQGMERAEQCLAVRAWGKAAINAALK